MPNIDQRAARLFQSLLDLEEPARAEALARACEGDAALRERVLSLLAEDARLQSGDALSELLALKPQATAPLAEAQQRVDRYVLLRRLGAGGMAEVWAARHETLGSEHAVKLLHLSTPEVRERLLREGRIQAKLAHPNIVRVTDVVRLPHGLGLVMEWVRGPTLRERLGAGRLPLDEAVALATGILQGVAYVHREGLIHRDIKPENVLLEPHAGGLRPRVSDFGLAKALAEAGQGGTRTGVGMGTPGYMAPEQHRDAARVGAQADVFSLGCVLYELLLGRRPFSGPDVMAIYQQILRAPLPPVGSLDAPPALMEVVYRALCPAPEDRPQDADALLQAWREAAERWAAPTEVREAAPVTRPSKPLPTPQGDFFGREEEQAALRERLRAGARLVTITGPAGSGKTRLLLELARSLGAQFPGGVWLCPLSETQGEGSVCFAVSSALDAPLSGEDPAGQLGYALRARGRCLLLLDNAEQVAPTLAALVTRWGARAPEASFLVTSQVPLGSAQEQVWALGSLPLPPEDEASVGALLRSPSVALFVARAAEQAPGFRLTPALAPVVRDLTRALDGLPLALELAAARSAVMSPQAMLARLDQRFRLLARRTPGEDRRRRTLQGALDWSWELLSGWEQAAFAQCSVFEGGFSLADAEAVLDISDHEGAPWALDAVEALVDRSLLRRTDDDALGEPRFGMYLSLQHYADGKLTGAARRGAHARHRARFARLGRPDARAALRGPEGVRRWWALRGELANLQAALRRAPEGSARAQTLQETGALAWAAGEVLAAQGPIPSAIEVFQIARRAYAEARGGAAEGEVVARLGALYQQQGRRDVAVETYEEALRLTEESGDPRALARRLSELADGLHNLGRMEESRAHFERALTLARAEGDRAGEAHVLGNFGDLLYHEGRLAEARQSLKRSLRGLRAAGDLQQQGVVLNVLGCVEGAQGQLMEAKLHFEAALEVHRALGSRLAEGAALCNLGNICLLQGQLPEAQRFYARSLQINREIGSRGSEGGALLGLGNVYVRRGQPRRALSTLEEALELVLESGNPRREAYIRGELGTLLREQGELSRAQEHVEASLTLAQELSDLRGEGIAWGELGLLRSLDGDAEGGAEAFALSEARLEQVGDREELGLVLSKQARLALEGGRVDEARALTRRVGSLDEALALGPDSRLTVQLSALRVQLEATEAP